MRSPGPRGIFDVSEGATLGKRYAFCDAFMYAADKVLLPAADYATTPTSYISGVRASKTD